MQEKFPIFAKGSLFFALWYVFCLFRNPSGITWPLFIAGAVFYFRFSMRELGIVRKKGLVFYEAALLLLGLSIFLSDCAAQNALTKTGIALLFLVCLIHAAYEDGDWDFVKYIGAGLKTVFSAIACIPLPFSHFNLYRKERAGENSAPKRRALGYVLLGALIALPFFFFAILMLSSADAVFSEVIDRIFRMFENLHFEGVSTPLQIGATMIYAFLLSYCLTAAVCKKEVAEDCPARDSREPIPAITVLVLLLLPYLLFCGIQIVYLFAGKGQLPGGYTYAEYARQGFFQLLFVCILNLLLVVVCTTFFRPHRMLKAALALVCGCTYVMLLSSAWRMLLYVRSYGLTFLRILVLWALAVIAVLMAGVALHVFRKGFPLFRFGVAVVTVCYILLAFARPDYLTARYNIGLEASLLTDMGYASGSAVDLTYLASLSADAAPVLLSPDLPEYLSEAAIGHNTCIRLYQNRMESRLEEQKGIRRLNLSRILSGYLCEHFSQ